MKIVLPAILLLLISLNSNSSELNVLNGSKLGHGIDSGWTCHQQSKIEKILETQTCESKDQNAFGIKADKIQAGIYLKNKRRIGMFYVGFKAQRTPEFGKMIERSIGKAKTASKPTGNSVVLRWIRNGYTVTLTRDNARDTGNITITANWVENM